MKVSALPTASSIGTSDKLVYVASPDKKAYTMTVAQFKALYPGDKGDTGGYYTPSMSSSGNLTWTASKSGMASVSSVNLKGNTGSRGSKGSPGISYHYEWSGYLSNYKMDYNAAASQLDTNTMYRVYLAGGSMGIYLNQILLYSSMYGSSMTWGGGRQTQAGTTTWGGDSYKPLSSYAIKTDVLGWAGVGLLPCDQNAYYNCYAYPSGGQIYMTGIAMPGAPSKTISSGDSSFTWSGWMFLQQRSSW